MDALIDLFAAAQSLLFETLVQPLVFALGLGQWMEVAFEGTGWLLVGLLVGRAARRGLERYPLG